MALLFTLVATLMGAAAALSTGYLLLLLAAAAIARRAQARRPLFANDPNHPAAGRVVVVIPAHNEEAVLGATLASLRDQDYPKERLEIVVVADNCTDETARLARDGGVTVLERTDPAKRGKGHALNWAVSLLLRRPDPADAYVIVDADTWVAPDFVRLMEAALRERRDRRDCCALQGRYGVLNAGDGWRPLLMAAAFELFNHVRPLGGNRLGFSVGLKGNGMGFTRAVLERAPWEGRSITEDIDYGLDLLSRHGISVGYLPEARVLAQMPVTGSQAASQRERWERGRYALLRQRTLPLLKRGLLQRDLRVCEAAGQLLLPPLAELSALILGWGMVIAAGAWLGVLSHPALWLGGFAGAAIGLAIYVVGGLAVAEVPREVYTALLRAPGYAIWKCWLLATHSLRRPAQAGEPEWVRTERRPISELAGESQPAAAPVAPSKP
ncbi:MAG: glycosyltransferase family 2 protein [Actinomycetota bacterium]